MSYDSQTTRYMRALNHGIFLNRERKLAGRRAAFSLAAEIMHEPVISLAKETETRLYSKNIEPVPRNENGEEKMLNLLACAATLEALCELKILERSVEVGRYALAIKKMYENETRPFRMAEEYESIERFVVSNIVESSFHRAPDCRDVSAALNSMLEGSGGRAAFGLDVLAYFLEEAISKDYLARFGWLRQVANYFNLESVWRLGWLKAALADQRNCLEKINALEFPDSHLFSFALRVANARGLFLFGEERRGKLVLRLRTLDNDYSAGMGIVENGVLSACLPSGLLSDDYLHAAMVLDGLKKSRLKTEMLMPEKSRRETGAFVLFFDSSSETLLTVCGSSQKDAVISGWFETMERKRKAPFN